MRTLHRKLVAALASLGLLLGGTLMATASPAAAAVCTVPQTIQNTYTGSLYGYSYINWSSKTNTQRGACFNIGVSGNSSGYRFVVYTQDVVDVGPVDDNGGLSIIQWHYCDGSTGWSNVVWDWNSVNWQYNESNGNAAWQSALMTPGANGNPGDFCFRFAGTTRWQDSLGFWFTSWEYPYNGTSGFSVGY